MKHTLIALSLAATVATAAQAADTKLWYDKPAVDWMTQALPIGHGELGAMVFGKTDNERIQFNEKSLWTGNERDVGSYQPFGDLFIELGHQNPQDYRRELDLERGVHTVSYTANGIRYKRELIASYPAGALAIRLTANKPGAYSGKLWLTDMHGADVLADGKRLTATGVLNNGMDYESQALVLNEGGAVAPVFDPGFEKKPVNRMRPEVSVLDGTKDVYLSLRGSDKPVFGFFSNRSNDDATPGGMPLVINGEWFDRGVSFQAPNDFSFKVDGKYQWLTFHAQVAAGGALQIVLDGNRVKEIAAGKDTQYLAIPVAGVKTLKIQGVSRLDPKSRKFPDVLLGHLRLSPSKTEPAKDPGVAHRWKTNPGFNAMIPPVALAFEKCDGLTILLGAKTSYLADHTKGWRGPHPHEALTALMDKAVKQPFGQLLAAHEKDYRNLFDRVTLEFGKTPAEVSKLPTDQRFVRYAKGGADPGFEPLVFQFGRYLLIASSRHGGLPANLQGVWNVSTAPPWRGDYHSNIDLQMNYWPSDLTGLGECHVPLLDFIAAQAPVYRKNMLTDPEMVKRFPKSPGMDDPDRNRRVRCLGLGTEHPRQRLVQPTPLAALRVRPGPRVSARESLPAHEGNLRVLDGPSDHHARRTARHARRLVGRVGSARVGRDLRPGTDLGPLQQHRCRRRCPWGRQEIPGQDRRDEGQAGYALYRQARAVEGMARGQGRHGQHLPACLAPLGVVSWQADHRARNARLGRRCQSIAQCTHR
jgi:hypothetical protein